MLRIVLTGSPGGGKTAVLADLGFRGHCTVPDSARSVIAERLRNGQSPRPPALEFATEILRRDVEAYVGHGSPTGIIFYDRGVVDALGMLDQATTVPSGRMEEYLMRYAYCRKVFVFPPWREIYRRDAERDQSFAEAEAFHPRIMGWYRTCGYEPVEVPRGSVEQRSAYVLRMLGRRDP
jgi:predicted ATPase